MENFPTISVVFYVVCYKKNYKRRPLTKFTKYICILLEKPTKLFGDMYFNSKDTKSAQ